MLGRVEQAESHFQMALRLNARMGARPAVAHTYDAYAELLRARGGRGDLEHARKLFEAALAIYAAIGAPHHVARIQDILSVPGLAPSAAQSPALPDGLTEREVEVLQLIAAGCNNREIADQLVLSVRTVERHITNIYGKIKARGKADATSYAMTRGLVMPRSS